MASKPCRQCKKNLCGEVIDALGGTYHAACFKCATCGTQLGNKFVDVDDQPYCDVCGKAAFISRFGPTGVWPAHLTSLCSVTKSGDGAAPAASAGDGDSGAKQRLEEEKARLAAQESAAAKALEEQRLAIRSVCGLELCGCSFFSPFS